MHSNRLAIITPVADGYEGFLPDLRVNIKTRIAVPYVWCIVDGTTSQELASLFEDNASVIVIPTGKNLGIFAAKYEGFKELARKGFHTFTYIDADDYYSETIDGYLLSRARLFDISYFYAYDAAKHIDEARQPYTWRYILSVDALTFAYEIIRKWAGAPINELFINSCEDILLTAGLINVDWLTFDHTRLNLIEHTENPVSCTNSTHYEFEKVARFWGDWRKLVDIARASKSEYLINIMKQCFHQYRYQRQFIPMNEREKTDELIKVYKELTENI